MTTNAWCQTLGVHTPVLGAAVGHREGNTSSLLLVALLERGARTSAVREGEAPRRARRG